MSLRRQVLQNRTPVARSSSQEPSASRAGAELRSDAPAMLGTGYQMLKISFHQKIIERVDLEKLYRQAPEQVRTELAKLTDSLIGEDNIMVNDGERRQLVNDVFDEMFGLGPLEQLLQDPGVSDIMVNTYRDIYVERAGKLQRTALTFYDNAHLMKIIERIVSKVGRRIDESSPMVDARLADGSRVNAIIPPLAVDGPLLSIRRFPATRLNMGNLIEKKSLTAGMAQLLEAMVQAKLNVLISGGTGSGKTTLLNLLSAAIHEDERIITVEDAAELQLQQEHVLRLETRPANLEGQGDINQQALLRNTLRMRPDRIILGEVRGAEAFDMLNAMNTGHEGSLATLHANSPRHALSRLENMVTQASSNMTAKNIRYQIASAVHVVIQVSRLSDGCRKVLSIQEITGLEEEVISMQEVFTFKRTGIDGNGKVSGHFCATGVRPHFCERLAAYGIQIPDNLFDPALHVAG